MKNVYFVIVIIMLISFLLIPLFAVESPKGAPLISSEQKNSASKEDETKEFKVYIKESKEIITVSKTEYIIGVLAAEMNPEYNTEALKAQGLAGLTYAFYKAQLKEQENYDITNDPLIDQGYLTKAERTKKWSSKAEEYENKLTLAAREIENLLIVYNEEPILAAYHSVSAGNTESSQVVWGKEYPYLVSVTSVGDLLAPDFLSEVRVSVEDFKLKLAEFKINFVDDPLKYIEKTSKSKAGTVLNLTILSTQISGTKIREIFGLRSAAFDVAFTNNEFVFTVSGYGHLVGMSQFGANYMAEQGSDFKQIITTYYKGVQIKEQK